MVVAGTGAKVDLETLHTVEDTVAHERFRKAVTKLRNGPQQAQLLSSSQEMPHALSNSNGALAVPRQRQVQTSSPQLAQKGHNIRSSGDRNAMKIFKEAPDRPTSAPTEMLTMPSLPISKPQGRPLGQSAASSAPTRHSLSASPSHILIPNRVVVLYDFSGLVAEGKLSVKAGATLTLQQVNGEWAEVVDVKGAKGWIPSTYIRYT